MEGEMTMEGGQALVERYIAAYNSFDIEDMPAQLADEVRVERHAGGRRPARCSN